jgi:hypothetical protein
MRPGPVELLENKVKFLQRMERLYLDRINNLENELKHPQPVKVINKQTDERYGIFLFQDNRLEQVGTIERNYKFKGAVRDAKVSI